MAAQVLDFGVRRGHWPAPHVCCACGSTRDASRGYPNDVWYCAPCVPPELRFPWERGYAAPAVAAVAELPAVAAAAPAAVDLMLGLSST